MESDRGFLLLEVIVGMIIVSIVMTALTVVFVTGLRSTTRQRAEQAAVRLVTEQADAVRALPADVVAQRAAAPQVVTVNGADYRMTTKVANCYQPVVGSGPASCTASKPAGTSYVTSQRITITAVWDEGSCGSGSCSYSDSVVVNHDRDPIFPINNEPPPSPVLSGCTDQTVTIGQQINMDLRGPQIRCHVADGVSPMTWSIDPGGLPAGLTLGTTGLVTGTVEGPAGSVTSTATVTDAFLRPSTDHFTWNVVPPLMSRSLWLRSDRPDFAVSVPLKNFLSDGKDGYGYELIGGTLPPGLSLDVATGVISGHYDRKTGGDSGDYPLTIRITAPDGTTSDVRFMFYARTSAGEPNGNGMALCPTVPLNYSPQIQLASNPPPCSIPGHDIADSSPASSVAEFKVGQPITPFSLWDNAYGQMSPYRFEIDANAPSWIHVDEATGIVTGTPTETTDADWEQNVQFQVYDAEGRYATVTVYWRVIP